MLHAAAEDGDVSLLRGLLLKTNPDGSPAYDINEPRDYSDDRTTDFTPLHFAAFNGHAEAVTLLLHYGADINAVDAVGATPLQFAAQSDVETTRAFLLFGARCDAADNEGITALHLAATTCRTHFRSGKTVELLIAYGANAHVADRRGASPLFCGCVKAPAPSQALEGAVLMMQNCTVEKLVL